MNRRLFLCGLAAAVAASPLFAADQPAGQAASGKPAGEKSRILFVTQSKGFVHGSVKRSPELSPAEIAMKQLGQQTGLFEVDCTQDAAADFTKENLKNYDVVMFYTTGDLPIAQEDLDYFFNEWLKAPGHGFIGFHSASDTYHKYEPYWDMVGGTFAGHPWNAGETVVMTVHDPGHPTMQPFGGESVEWKDEIYQYSHWQPEKVRVLMSLDMEKTNLKRPYHVPVAWVKEYGQGKVYYNNLGHNEATWTKPAFLESVANAVRWVRGDVQGAAEPNPEVSAKEEEKAKAAVKE